MSLTPLSSIPDFIFFCFAGVFTFFTPMYESLLFLIVFIVIDMISGISLAQHKKEKIEFKKLFTSVTKIFYYVFICISGYILDVIFIKEALGQPYIFSMFILLLALSEFKSIINNFSRILGIDIWTKVIKAFRNKSKLLEDF